MENVLAVYQRPRDPKRPLVCLDEAAKQLVSATRLPIPMTPGHVARHDFEYKSGSFLKLVRQLAEHEAHIRRQDAISFKDGSSVLLNDRPIEKIGISLFDHGSLQNRDLTMGLIEGLVNSQITTDDKNGVKIADGVNTVLSRLNAALQVIVSTQRDGASEGLFRFAMSTWWLSIDQLQYLSMKEGDLWTTMQRVRHMTARSGDLVYEVNRALNLNIVGEAVYNLTTKMDSRGYM